MPIPVMVALEGNSAGLTAALGSAGGAMSAFGGASEGVAQKMGAAFANMNSTLTAFGISAIESAAQFETVMMRVYTSSNISKDGLAQMSQSVLDLSTTVGYAATDLGTAMKYVVSSGFDGADAVNVLRIAAQGAQVGVGNLGDTAKSLSTIMYDLHMPASDATKAMEALMASVRIGQVELGQLSTSMANVMPVAVSAGLGLNEIAAAMATMTAQGTPAVNAGTQLRMTIMQLERPTQSAAKAMQNFGLDANDVSTKLGERGLSGTLQLLTGAIDTQLGTALSGMDAQLSQMATGSLEEFQAGIDALPASQRTAIGALAEMLGGVKSLQGAIQLTGSHTQDFANNIKKVTDAANAAGTDVSKWGDMAGTTGVKWENLKNQLKEFAIQVGDLFLPMAKKMLDSLNSVFAWFQDHPAAMKAAFIAVATAMGITAIFAGILAIAMFGLMLPFILIGAILAGIVLGIIWLVKHFDELPHYAMVAVKGVLAAFMWLFGPLISMFVSLWNTMWGIWTNIINFIIQAPQRIAQSFYQDWTTLTTIVGNAMAVMWAIILSIGTAIGNFFSGLWNSLTSSTASAFNSIVGFVMVAMGNALVSITSFGTQMLGSIISSFGSALGAASGFIGSFTQVGSQLMQGVVSGIMAMAGSIASAAASVVRNALNAAKSAIGISSPSKDFHEQVGMPISQGIARGIEAARPLIEQAVNAAVRGPLSGDYAFQGSFDANHFGGNFKGTANIGGGPQININVDFSGNFYGQGGARQAATDIQRELLRMQQSQDLGFLTTARRQLGV